MVSHSYANVQDFFFDKYNITNLSKSPGLKHILTTLYQSFQNSDRHLTAILNHQTFGQSIVAECNDYKNWSYFVVINLEAKAGK